MAPPNPTPPSLMQGTDSPPIASINKEKYIDN